MAVQQVVLSPQPGPTVVGLSQSLGGAGNFSINGSLASGGEVDFSVYNVMHKVCVRSSGDDSGLTFTFTGEDMQGNTIQTTAAGTNGGWSTSPIYFAKITQISSDGATDGNVTLAARDECVSDFLQIDLLRNPLLIAFSVELSDGANFIYSMQNAQSDSPSTDTTPFVVYDPRLISLRKSNLSTAVTPASGYRIIITDYVTGTATFRIRQGGV